MPPQFSHLHSTAMLVGVLVWASAVPCGLAAEGESPTITSQTMTIEGGSRRAIFEGTVVLKKGDFIIRSDRMIVTFEDESRPHHSRKDDKDLRQKIQRIDAIGNVVIEQSDGKATSGHAVYYTDEEKIVLTESPMAWQNGTQVTGSRMTMFLHEDRSLVEGGSQVTILNDLVR